MEKSKKLLMYSLKQGAWAAIGNCAAILIICFIISILTKEWEMLLIEMELFLFLFMFHDSKYNYLSFGFCRKEFFRFSFISSVMSIFIFTVFRTVMQTLYHDSYVQMLIEDTDHVSSMYHRLQVPELFLSNFLLFFAVYMLLLWDSTKPSPLFYFGKRGRTEMSLQLKVLTEQRKSNQTSHTKIWYILRKAVGFCLMIGIALGIEFIYEYQMTHSLGVRLPVLLGEIIVGIFFFFLARRKFKPEFM